jgi:ketosteroid isomerase-like protein
MSIAGYWRAMSQGRGTASAIELTRRLFESANGGDFDAMMRFYGPDSVWDVSGWGLGSHAGLVSIRAFFGDWIGGFERWEVELEELLDVGGGRVFLVACQYARLARTRGHFQLRYAAVFVWDEGVIVRATHYRDVDQARVVARHAGERAARDQLYACAVPGRLAGSPES